MRLRPREYAHLHLSQEAARHAARAGLAPSDVESHTDRWCHGDCHFLTLALHTRFGWPMWTFAHGAGGLPLHSGVTLPDGRLLDMRGARPLAEMRDVCAMYWGEGVIEQDRALDVLLDMAAIEEDDLAWDPYIEDALAVIDDALQVLAPAVAAALQASAPEAGPVHAAQVMENRDPAVRPAPATDPRGRGRR